MLPPGHCFGGGMMMILCILCLAFCRILKLFSEMKLPPAPDFFLGRPYYKEVILHASIRLSVVRSSVFLIMGNLL